MELGMTDEMLQLTAFQSEDSIYSLAISSEDNEDKRSTIDFRLELSPQENQIDFSPTLSTMRLEIPPVHLN